METIDENFDRNRLIDLFTFFIENLLLYCQSLARTSSRILRNFFQNMQIADIVDTVSDKLTEHPILRFVALATALSCAIPIVMFVAFGVVSIVVTFAGFLFIEGTILAVGGLCMFICLVTMILVMSVMAVTLGMLYVIALKLGVVLNKYESTSHLLKTLLPSLAKRDSFDISRSIANGHQD